MPIPHHPALRHRPDILTERRSPAASQSRPNSGASEGLSLVSAGIRWSSHGGHDAALPGCGRSADGPALRSGRCTHLRRPAPPAGPRSGTAWACGRGRGGRRRRGSGWTGHVVSSFVILFTSDDGARPLRHRYGARTGRIEFVRRRSDARCSTGSAHHVARRPVTSPGGGCPSHSRTATYAVTIPGRSEATPRPASACA